MSIEFDTVYPADSVEFCPDPNSSDIFVCGTYKLLQSSDTNGSAQRRVGQCLVYRYSYDESIHAEKVHEVDMPAIPDMKWCHSSASRYPVLGIADSEGNISLHEWNRGESRLEKLSSVQVAPTSEILCLSLDWSNRRYPGSELGRIVTSLSNGSVCVLDSQSLQVASSWHAHDFEPWIAAWDYWNPNVVLSGGDDLRLKAWDVREEPSMPIFTNKRFDAGVTTIQSHPYVEHLFAVGSYDSRVRLIDIRNPQKPLVETDVGGGVWRVKWHPSETRKTDLLVACMHDGFKVVRFDTMNSAPSAGEVVKRYDGHESLAYGVDWSFGKGKDGETVIASCSFYDHNLHMWTA